MVDEDELAAMAAPWHWPADPSFELHVSGGGQPLPPVPRQPVVQVCLVVSQTRPDVAPPQSASVVHPQVSSARQAAPVPFALQFFVWCAVHWWQVFIASQTCSSGQSVSFRHCTHPWGCSMVSHTGVGFLQSALELQGSAVHTPTVPFIWLQYLPVEQLSTTPASPFTTRHPAVQVPVFTLEVSQ
jgi:hypothetical protein